MGDKTGEASSEFAEAVAGNEDLLLQILLRVPVRPLIRLKLVSKPWKALISGEEFGRNHTRIGSLTGTKPHSPSGLYFNGSQDQLHSVSLTAENHGISPPSLSILVEAARVSNFRFDVLQSCNGLLLCSLTRRFRGSDAESYYSDAESYYMVLNPTIMETKVVPLPKRNSADVGKVLCSLYFDPVESPHFKVVCFKIWGLVGRYQYSNYLHFRTYEILIYSSESDSWRSCGNFVPPVGIRSEPAVSCNGVIYWIGNSYLLHFRIDTESMTTSELPQISPIHPERFRSRRKMFFGECGGHLHLILQSGCHSETRFKFFELNKETLEWLENPFYCYAPTISGFLQERFRHYIRGPSALSIIRRDKEKESAIVVSIPGQVMSYNYFNNTTQLLGEFPGENPEEVNPTYSTTYHYIETLSPLKQFSLATVQSTVAFCQMFERAPPIYYLDNS